MTLGAPGAGRGSIGSRARREVEVGTVAAGGGFRGIGHERVSVAERERAGQHAMTRRLAGRYRGPWHESRFPSRSRRARRLGAATAAKMAVGMGALSEAVYGNTQLPLREREAARWTIALINDCAVCRDTRARDGEQAGIDDGFYSEVASWRTSEALTDRERLAAEFAERFALDHLAMDDAFWARLRGAFADDEIADLTICCGMFLGMGRTLAVIGVRAPDERILV